MKQMGKENPYYLKGSMWVRLIEGDGGRVKDALVYYLKGLKRAQKKATTLSRGERIRIDIERIEKLIDQLE